MGLDTRGQEKLLPNRELRTFGTKEQACTPHSAALMATMSSEAATAEGTAS